MPGKDVSQHRTALAALAIMFLMVGLPSVLLAEDFNGPMGSVPDTDSEPNNSVVEATLLDQPVVQFHGALSPTDPDDYFRIVLNVDEANKVADRFDVQVKFDSWNTEPSATIIDQWGFVLDFKPGTNDTLSVVTAPDLHGNFYIRLHVVSGQTGYDLKATVTQQSFTHQDKNNQPSSAVRLQPLDPDRANETLSGDPDPSDYQDFYRIRIEALDQERPGFVSVHMKVGPKASYRLELYDNYLTLLASKVDLSDPVPGSPQVLSYVTPVSADLYLRVWAANGTGPYNLTVYLLTITDRSDWGLDQARDLVFNGTEPHVTVLMDSLGYNTYDPQRGDIGDMFKMDVVAGQLVEIKATSVHFDGPTGLPHMSLRAYDQDGNPYQFNRSGEHLDGAMGPIGDLSMLPDRDGTIYFEVGLDGNAPGGGGYSLDVFTDRPPQVVKGVGPQQDVQITDTGPTELVDMAQLFHDPEGDALGYAYAIEDPDGTRLQDGLGIDVKDGVVTLTPWPRFEGHGALVLTATESEFGISTKKTYEVSVGSCGCHRVEALEPYNIMGAFPEPIKLVYGVHEIDTSIDLSRVFGDPLGHLIEFTVEGDGVLRTLTDVVTDTGLTNGTGPGSDAFLVGPHMESALVKGVVRITPGRNPVTSGVPSTLVLSLTDEARAGEVEIQTKVRLRAWPFAGRTAEASVPVELTIKVVRGPGHAPQWALPGSLTFKEDGAITIKLDQYAYDEDRADNGTLTYRAASTKNNISATQVDRETFTLRARPSWCGVERVMFTAKDTYGLTATGYVEVGVGCVPKGPSLQSASPPTDESIVVFEGEEVVFSVLVSDPDSGPSALVYDWYVNGYPAMAGGGPTFKLTPGTGTAGNHTVSVQASDSLTGMSVRANWTLTVRHINQAPKAWIDGPGLKNGTVEVRVGNDLRLTGNGLDPEGKVLSYSWDLGDSSYAVGRQVTHSYGAPGRYTATLVASDGELSTYVHVNVTVKAQGVIPVATPKVFNSTVGLWAGGLMIVVALFGLGSTEPGKFRLSLLFMVLYTKLKGTEVLDHYIRGRIQGYITANPGAHYNMIKADLQINNGNLAYHLKVLERQGYIKSMRDGIYKRFYPETMKVLRPPSLQERILVLLRNHPGLSQREIARELDSSQSTVNDYIRRMSEANLVKVERAGVTNHCFVVEME